MNKQDFINKIDDIKVEDKFVSSIEQIYGIIDNEVVKKLISINDNSFSIEGEIVLLLNNQILTANNKYDYNFVEEKMLPIADCSDNDLLVYCINKKVFAKFNTIDKILFKQKMSVQDLI